MQNIDWIFFDIGGVIADESTFNKWRDNDMVAMLSQYKSGFTQADLYSVLPEASSMLGSLGPNVIKLALKDSGLIEQAMTDFNSHKPNMPDYYDSMIIRSEAKEVLPSLSKKYKLGIMANQHTVVKDKLKTAGIFEYFHHTEVSHDHGLAKPNPELFKKIFKQTGSEPTRSVMIDDNIERGLIPAKKFGMVTVWYKLLERSVPDNAVDYTIASLKDLLKIF